MKASSLLLILLIILTACSETPEVSSQTSINAEKQIKVNQNEAKQAQKEYLELQKQRSYE